MEATVIPDDFGKFAELVLNAAKDGQWPMLAALGLVGAVWALRKFGSPALPFLATSEGGVVLNIATSFAGALLTALLGRVAFTWAMIWTALQVSVLAAGGWSLLKSLVFPLLLRIPALAKLFSRGDAQASIVVAQKEGLAAAVQARPPKSEDVANEK